MTIRSSFGSSERQSLGDQEFLHGSKELGLKALNPFYSQERSIFGPGIYLTKDPLVASCYSRGSGSIYRVKISGDPAFTINLDLGFEGQTPAAQLALHNSTVLRGKSLFVDPLRDVIYDHVDHECKQHSLRSTGIWLVYGHAHPMEQSGLMDRGVQYVVIASRCAQIEEELTEVAALKRF